MTSNGRDLTTDDGGPKNGQEYFNNTNIITQYRNSFSFSIPKQLRITSLSVKHVLPSNALNQLASLEFHQLQST
jgi:hypothetical protein